MDLFRTDDHYMLYADLPGVDPGSIDIQVDGDVLTIRAHRTLRDDDGAQWISSERFGGSYLRRLSLGEQVDAGKIEATYANGVLAISIPLVRRTEPRKVSVSIGNGAAVQPALTGAGSEGG
jgi:HSP20 family protein